MSQRMYPVHGSALCPEDYMLKSDGTPWAHYADVWSEAARCGRRTLDSGHAIAPPEPDENGSSS